MEIEINKNNYDRETLWIIGLTIKGNCNYFVVFKTGDKDQPLTKNDKIILYDKNEIKLIFSFNKGKKVENSLDFVYDISKVIKIIENLDSENSGYLLDCINLSLDALSVLKINYPNSYVSLLNKIADYLTFDKDLNNELIDKKDLLNAMFWIHGTIISNLTTSN